MFKPGDKVFVTVDAGDLKSGCVYTVGNADSCYVSLLEIMGDWRVSRFTLSPAMPVIPGPGRTPGDTGPHLIGLQGYARSGKDSVAAVLGGYGYTRVAFADPLRDALYALDPAVPDDLGQWCRLRNLVNVLGWEAAKDSHPEIRRLLKVLGTEVVRDIVGENVWVDIAVRKIESIVGAVVVTDVRFPNEVEAIRQRGGEIWQIERPDHGPLDGHSSEALPCADPDCRILNGGDLEALARHVDFLLASSR